jgi:competence protein ComGC
MRLHYFKHPVKGFTLVELLIYMGVLAIFIGTLTSLFTTSVNVQLESESISGVEQDGRYLLSKLSYDIHRAESVTAPESPGDSSTTLVMVIDGQTHTYAMDDENNLLYTTSEGSFQLNAHDTRMGSLVFERIGNVGGVENTIVVSLEIESRVQTQPPTEPKSFTTAISLRRQ